MYLCLCNGLTDSQIAGVIAAGAHRPKEVYGTCGCRAQCGSCTRVILAMIRDTLADSARPPPPATAP
ncbi:MAG TPA: (2Fe-2S)-binding protein [Crenalkalicoccus sp.]|jgi:bacterioferritin-associated ferredoxin|nr:(2Fe-2S)-binding protein [Crenalkalicoccus sp.]